MTQPNTTQTPEQINQMIYDHADDEYRAAADEARVKAERLEDLYGKLPDSTARPAVAAWRITVVRASAWLRDEHREGINPSPTKNLGIVGAGFTPARAG